MPDVKELVRTLLDKQKEQFETLQGKQMIELNGVKQELIENSNSLSKDVTNLQEHFEELETQMKKGITNANNVPLTNSIAQIVNGKAYQEAVVAKVNQGDIVDYGFELKLIRNAADVVYDPHSFTAGVAPVVLPMRELGVDKAPVAPPAVADLIQWGTTSSNLVDWVERTSKTDGAAGRNENDKMKQGDTGYTEVSTKVKIFSEFFKATNESLKDASFLSGEINSELLSDLKVLVDNQLLTGDGTGTNLKGILQYATAFAAGASAATVVEPNFADVLRVAINQVLTNGKMRWYPSAILMHPDDVTTLDLLKIADGRYIEVPYYDAESRKVINVPIHMNTGVAAGTFLVADFSKAKAFVRDSLSIRVYNQNEDDALHNRSTITGNIRLAFRIKNQETGAFVKGDFAAAITALKKP